MTELIGTRSTMDRAGAVQHFSTLSNAMTRSSAKWTTHPPGVLPLDVAEMDVRLAEPIARALRSAIDKSDVGYAAPRSSLFESFTAFADEQWEWAINPDGLALAPDVSVAAVELLRQLLPRGGRVIACTPVYGQFAAWAQEANVEFVGVPLLHDSQTLEYKLNFDLLEAEFNKPGPSCFLLCNPHNPLGLVFRRSDLETLAEIAHRHKVPVVSDEVHAPLVFDRSAFTPYLAVAEGLCMTSSSKAFNIAGLKCALIVASPSRAELLSAMPAEMRWRTGHLGVLASVAAFTLGSDWLERTRAALQFNASYLHDLLRSEMPHVLFTRPQASFLGWLEFRGTNWSVRPTQTAIQRGVALAPGSVFGTSAANLARINFGSSPDVLDEAVRRLSRQA